jgi:hypothetical protein
VRDLERHTAWACPRCHDQLRSPIAMPAPYHLCDRSGRVENWVVAWTPQRAAEIEPPKVRALKAVA